jgi:hypothetical protein
LTPSRVFPLRKCRAGRWSDKGIAGPTAAHVIEEIHTPLNLALVTFTTGSSAFQNIVGVTQNELRCVPPPESACWRNAA